eukprot:CAMPEP_0113518378 /NCGR_PEP_ID=MMETSP0014_2-20120614/42886_1 /TAXON_ID=2857 /ORGANISM="Nitzschia sp." /LENGTH=38 /DNA_ID=CAMNT_0000415889 /DNA_START=29 /DNA_END=145 /DNA_ORIENTATION=+ /assembly_acc=CAM_ASM_000159
MRGASGSVLIMGVTKVSSGPPSGIAVKIPSARISLSKA